MGVDVDGCQQWALTPILVTTMPQTAKVDPCYIKHGSLECVQAGYDAGDGFVMDMCGGGMILPYVPLLSLWCRRKEEPEMEAVTMLRRRASGSASTKAYTNVNSTTT